MRKIFFLFLFGLGDIGTALAQTPANNLMPDGSRDTYLGLAAVSAARYEGARTTRFSIQPALQLQWSNGVFIAGASAGLHLSPDPQHEYGPLLALEGSRDEKGTHAALAYLNNAGDNNSGIASVLPAANENKLRGMDEIDARLLVGGFYHVQLGAGLRWSNRLLAGYGNARSGLRMNTDLWYPFALPAPHHRLSLGLGASLVNQDYSQSYFGVTAAQSLRSRNPVYAPAGGIKDVHAQLHWNWALSSSCLLSSGLNWSRLTGAAADSPLVERRSGLSVSSALAYRF